MQWPTCRRPRHRAGQLHHALAGPRLPQELETNRLAHYLVARVGDEIVGYAGIWLMVDEAHVTTFAIVPRWRRQQLGERLLLALLDLAIARRRARPRWKSACPTCRRGACTRSSASARSASGRATTATTTRTR